MANKQRKYKRNIYGISMNDEFGKINITKPLWEHLDYPQHIEFSYVNNDWIKLTRGSADSDSSGRVVPQGKGLSINDAELVRAIYEKYEIVRNDKTVMSPFYNAEYLVEDGQRVVYVKLNNF